MAEVLQARVNLKSENFDETSEYLQDVSIIDTQNNRFLSNDCDSGFPKITHVESIDPTQFLQEDMLVEEDRLDFSDEEEMTSCAFCPFRSNSATMVSVHMEDSHTCLSCNKIFSLKANLLRHKQAHVAKEKVAPFRCGSCCERFHTFELFRKHFLTKHHAAEQIAANQALPLDQIVNIRSVSSVTSLPDRSKVRRHSNTQKIRTMPLFSKPTSTVVPGTVINFYPSAEQAAAMKHIHLEDASGRGSRHFLVSQPDGSRSIVRRGAAGELHAKRLLVIPRSRHSTSDNTSRTRQRTVSGGRPVSILRRRMPILPSADRQRIEQEEQEAFRLLSRSLASIDMKAQLAAPSKPYPDLGAALDSLLKVIEAEEQMEEEAAAVEVNVEDMSLASNDVKQSMPESTDKNKPAVTAKEQEAASEPTATAGYMKIEHKQLSDDVGGTKVDEGRVLVGETAAGYSSSLTLHARTRSRKSVAVKKIPRERAVKTLAGESVRSSEESPFVKNEEKAHSEARTVEKPQQKTPLTVTKGITVANGLSCAMEEKKSSVDGNTSVRKSETNETTNTDVSVNGVPVSEQFLKEDDIDVKDTSATAVPNEGEDLGKSKKKRKRPIVEYYILAVPAKPNETIKDINRVSSKSKQSASKRKSGDEVLPTPLPKKAKPSGKIVKVEDTAKKSPEAGGAIGRRRSETLNDSKTGKKSSSKNERRKSDVKEESKTGGSKRASMGGKQQQRYQDPKLLHVPENNPYARKVKSFRRRRDGEGEETEADGKEAFGAEVESNRKAALLEPYCHICQLLSDQTGEAGDSALTPVTGPGGAPRRLPVQSVVWVPSMAGTVLCPGVEDGGASETFPVSRLLVCSSCSLCVHAACYQVADTATAGRRGSNEWRCDRCQHLAQTGSGSVTCCFCRKSGGALKRTTDNKFVHSRCAVLIPETNYERGAGREVAAAEVLDLSHVPAKRWNMTCLICDIRGQQPAVHCNASISCMLSFHPACGLAAGVDCAIGPDNRIILRCGFCMEKYNLRAEERRVSKFDPPDIAVGAQVGILNNEETTAKTGHIVEIVPEEMFAVAFDDGTFCDTMEPEHVRSLDGGDLVENVSVDVLWQGKNYTGIYRGKNTLFWYKIRPTGSEEIFEFDRTEIEKLD